MPPPLFIDLYELTMAQAYLARDQRKTAVFELAVRRLPGARNVLIAAGLEQALAFVEQLRFDEAAVAYLAEAGPFQSWFLDELRRFRFSGEVWAVPEGTPVFANEPLVQVVAPIAEAQLVETFVMNQIVFATMVASKGLRSVLAAEGRPVIDFGSRRAHGLDAGIEAARALAIAGFAATSNVAAGQRYGLPVTGTMAHSFVQSYEEERQAFRAFAGQYPGTTLLVDTYDTPAGVQHVIDLAHEQGNAFHVGAIRLDSGDLAAHAREARRRLDAAGLQHVRIVASGGLDEHQLRALVAGGAPIDAFAVGTRVVTSEDAPSLDAAYKLVHYAGRDRAKRSEGKPSLPGRKQVSRAPGGDRIHRFEDAAAGAPLLRPLMRDGRRIAPPAEAAAVIAARRRAAEGMAALPAALRELDPAPDVYRVTIDEALREDRG